MKAEYTVYHAVMLRNLSLRLSAAGERLGFSAWCVLAMALRGLARSGCQRK